VLEPVDFQQLESALDHRLGWAALGVVAACYGLAWVLDRLFARFREKRKAADEATRFPGGMVRVFYPVAVLLLLLVARAIWRRYGPTFFFDIAIPLAVALAAIRMFVYALRRLFAKAEWLRTSERAIAFAIWGFAILYFTGALQGLAAELESIALPIGKGHVSLLTVITGAFVVVVTLVVTLWVSGAIESRIMAAQIDVNVRVVLSKVIRAALLVLGVLVALQTVGIDLTLLSVFGGALGVGVGLGLQKLASNYIAGFTILLDRSVRLGDIVTVDNRHGVVSRLTTRYVVIRSLDGIEAIVPNETLVTTTVLNHSYSNREARLAVPISVAYGTDLDRALALMVECANAHPRVLQQPNPPGALVLRFADSGIDLELGVWIGDPETGTGGLRSDLNRAIWTAFQANGIEVPYPQRDVRLVGSWPASPDTPAKA
jgi:small-conductance mechanosensitive channel